jgi:tight adherence protein C
MTSLIALAFFSGATLLLGIASLLYQPPAQRRLAKLMGEEPETGSLRALLTAPKTSLLEDLLRPFSRLGSSGELAEAMRRKLVQAGYRGESALVILMGGRVALPLALACLVLLVVMNLEIEGLRRMAFVAAAMCAGYVAPSYWLDKRRNNRQAEIRQALPDALDLLVVCLEAGLAMGAALARVAAEFVRTSPTLCGELRLVNAEMQAGKTSSEALRALSDRVGITEISSLVAMLVQTERFGTSVADALRVHCEAMRVQRIQKAEEVAQKASVKMIFPTLLFIFPSTIMIAIGPALINALATLRGL